MNLPRARIVRDLEASPLEGPSCSATIDGSRARVVRREVIDAAHDAALLMQGARQQAGEILERARVEAERQFEDTRQRAREAAAQDAAAACAAQRVREAKADQAASDRIIAIARLLAERLLLEQLRISPELLVPMAREAIAQFWHADAITVRARQADVDVLRAHAAQLGVPASTLVFEADETCTAGSLKVATGQGALDADVGMQLDRLVEALRR